MAHRIVLTADKTLMSSYNASMFIGFAACFPRVLPKWLYTRIFCPTQHSNKGIVKYAPCGLRKIEASLVASGVPAEDIAIAHPDKLREVVDESTKVIGINTSDPMGLGPASSTFSSLLGRETYTAYFFRKLVTDISEMGTGAKVIVGGPGAWQLANDSVREDYGIDTLVEGEGEDLAPGLFGDALYGRPMPKRVTGGVVPTDHIPMSLGPTVNGLVEVSRGCGRGCEFCNPNMRQVRHIPMDRILQEVRLNISQGTGKITIHAEDVLRYGAKGVTPDKDKISKLFEEATKITGKVGISHLALSSALSEPSVIEDISRITGATDGKRTMYCQTGIETGSPEVVGRHMKGKAKPFQPEEWPTVVRESFKLLRDNRWVPCGTLVLGLPGERPEDVSRTIELVRDLRPYKSLIVPLFFVPLGELKDDDFFRPDAMLPEHWVLLAECIKHDFHWASTLMEDLFAQNRLSTAKSSGLKLAAWYMQRRLRPYMELMEAGKSPIEARHEGHAHRHAGEGSREQAEA
jgi:radical SAM superfamily enzyme YgiQ (UPF0313 family)